MMNDELSKSQKKIARALIDKGLELECDILTDEDLADLDENVRNRLIGLKNIFNSRLKTGL